MNRRTILTLILALGLAWSTAGTALAQGGGSAEVDWWVIAGGGGSSSGDGVTLDDTLGQPVTGLAGAGGLTFSAGYWTGVINGAETTTTLVSSLNPSVAGQPVTFSATVTSTAGTPAGLVTFAGDGAYIAGCTSLALDGNGQAACTTASLAAGTHTITGLYSGNASYNPSTGALVQQVNCADAIVVANNADGGPGSLRQAIADLCPGGTITFGGDWTITLASTLAITKPMTIDGESRAVTVSGNDAVRAFQVYTGTHVTLDTLTIAHGMATIPEYGSHPTGGGIKIESGAAVTLTHSALISNTATYYDPVNDDYYGHGGGVFNLGTLAVIETTFVDNVASSRTYQAEGAGGAIHNLGTLTVTGSTLTGNAAEEGGAIYSQYGTLAVTGSTFTGNAAERGGAIYGRDGTLAVTGSTLTGNEAEDGGAIYARDGAMAVTGSTLTGNTAVETGGAIYNRPATTMTVESSTISNNSALCGGSGIENRGTATVNSSTISGNVVPTNGCEGGAAGISNSGGTMTVTHSIISGNTNETNSGGGLSNYGYNPEHGWLTVVDSTIYNNTTTGLGGGIYNWWDATLTVINSEIYSNTATLWGGGILSGGNIYTTLTLVNSTLWHNSAESGGGVCNGSSAGFTGEAMSIINSTVVSNTATVSGGGFYNWNSVSVTLDNMILWGNTAPTGPQVYNSSTNRPTLSNNDIEGSGGSGAGWDATLGADGGGNIDADPLFVDAAGYDLRLQLTSAAIDAGDNGAVPVGVTTDLDGHPRFADVPSVPDTGLGTPPIVDMGAYEAGPALALRKSVTPAEDVAYQGVVTYTLLLENAGTLSDTVLLTDTLPAGVAFGGWVVEPADTIRQGDTITWTGTLAAGEDVTGVFTATHTGGYGDEIVNTAYYSGTAQAGSASAAFTVEQGYSLTVHVDGAGSGVVTLDPPSGIYPYGTLVTLTATADTGSTFAGWSGDASGMSATITTTMTADQVVTATFDLLTYTLAVYTDGAGSGVVTLDPAGGVYDYGTVVTLTAMADTGSTFAGWSGDASGVSATVTTTMTADQVVTATFDLLTYTLVVYTGGTGSGAVTLDPPGGVYDYGTVVTLTATADTGSAFAGWSGDASGTSTTVTTTVTADQVVTATFDLLMPYTLTVYTDGEGSGVVTLDPAGGVYNHGTVVTLTATADTGSTFAGWSGDASGVSPTITTTMTADQVITATFNLLTYTLTVYTDGTGSGTVELDPPGGVYDYGTLVTLTAMANVSSTFTGWSGACSGPGDCSVIITASQAVTATFDLTQYRVYLPLVSR